MTTTIDPFTAMTNRTVLFARATMLRLDHPHYGAATRLDRARREVESMRDRFPQWAEEPRSKYNGPNDSTTWRVDDTADHDGFEVFVTATLWENGADLSHLGKFTDRWEDGAVNLMRIGEWCPGSDYFVPAYTYAEARADAPRGMSRHDTDLWARARVMEQYETARDYQDYILEVRATLNGRVWGEDVLGGCWVDPTHYGDQFLEDVRDMVYDNGMVGGAVEEATRAYEGEMRRFLERRKVGA